MEIYVDHSATTPVDSRVLDAMLPYFSELFYNPSSLYGGGQRARLAIESAREATAGWLRCKPSEVIFTSGGTEADNMAIFGVMLRGEKKKLITSSIEHHAVLAPAERLKAMGFEVEELPVCSEGFVEPEALEKAMDENTALVSVMWANNETGAVQPVEELCDIAHRGGALFHTDAVQAAGTQAVDLQRFPADLLSFSAHKIYGPKGAGALFARSGVELLPRSLGGQQENYRRGGTENVAGIVGLGKAVELLSSEREERCVKLASLASELRERLSLLDGIRFNTPENGAIPGVINISCRGAEAEPLMILLGRAGICASMGAACNSSSVEPSHVLRAMGVPDGYIRGSLRISFGKDSTPDMPELIASGLERILRRIRK